MKNKRWGIFLLVVIFLFGLWLRTYNLGNRYSFEWDQNDDAVKVMGIVHGQYTLIGPRVAGPDSFFVAPWHYYFLAPFYAIGHGDPIAGAYAATLVGLLTVLAYYWVGLKMWGQKEGLVAAWAGAIGFSIVSWNVMYTPLLSIVIFYMGNKILEGKGKFWVALALSIFAGTTHLVPATLVVMIMATYLLVKNKPSLKSVIMGGFLGLLSLTPLLLFDLRHNFLISHKVVEFLTTSSGGHNGLFNFLAWRAYFRGFSLMGFKISDFWYIAERLFLAVVMILGILMTKEKNKRLWYILWFVFPAIVLLFYWRNIPEYYFGVVFALFPLFIALVSKKYRLVVCVILAAMSVVQINRVLHSENQVSLNDKKAVVKFMSSYTEGKHFNFSYDVPFGEEIGYPYLFSWIGHEPENIPEARLYTLSRKPLPTEKVIYSNKGLNIIER